jgi:hypothetical protein
VSEPAPRRAARPAYDALVDLTPREDVATHAYALAKFTFAVARGTLELSAPAEPLRHDFRDARGAPRLRPGTDFWPRKEFTDLSVQGAAHPPARGARTMRAGVRFGEVHKHVAVFGRREVRFNPGGDVEITAPEPLGETPVALSWANAYGGVDHRAARGEISGGRAMLFLTGMDHPGIYPRNPFGKGYTVEASPPGGAPLELPQLEDPSDLLTPERVVVRDPARWYAQPLPWCFDWLHPMMFPRYFFAPGAPDAWFPAPEDHALPEVRRGILMEGFRAARAQAGVGMHPRFFQEASSGMVLRAVRGGEPVELTGMHPEHGSIAFTMPVFDPVMAFDLEGERVPVRPRLHSVVIHPAALRVELVYGADVALRRYFVPGVHKCIPVGISVMGEAPVMYEAPEPVRERLARAGVSSA